MTNPQFYNTFYGPANKSNRKKLCVHLGISGFAGLSLNRMGWTGFVNALGDYYGLDVRNFSCQAAFIDELASKMPS